jgi:hypothetical protein
MDDPTISTSDGSKDTIGDLKTRFANLLINRVALSECLNVIRDACVQRATELIDQADAEQIENIKKDVELFENPPKEEGAGESQGVQGQQDEVTPIDPTTGPQEGVQGPQS